MNYTQNGVEIVKNVIQSDIYAFISDKAYNESDEQLYQDIYEELRRVNVEPIMTEYKPIIIQQKPQQQLPPPGDTIKDEYQIQDVKFLNVSGKVETKKKEVLQQSKPQQKKMGSIDMFLKKKQQ